MTFHNIDVKYNLHIRQRVINIKKLNIIKVYANINIEHDIGHGIDVVEHVVKYLHVEPLQSPTSLFHQIDMIDCKIFLYCHKQKNEINLNNLNTIVKAY